MPGSLLHLFTQCRKSHAFWNNLLEWIHRMTNVRLLFDNLTILLGYLNTDITQTPINTILITAKYYIFCCSKKNRHLSVPQFHCQLTKVYREQQMLSKLNQTEHIFEKKWARFVRLFD